MDIYKEVTERIITEMEKGIIPWEKPWIATGNCVAHTSLPWPQESGQLKSVVE